MTDEERKATDVLLSIENDIKLLIKSMHTYDLTSKIILDRVNFIHNYINKLELEIAEQNKILVDDKRQVPDIVMQIEENPVGTRRSSRVETVSPQLQTQPEASIAIPDNKKVPVTQRITDSNGKDLFMADVSIMNENKEVIHKVKTNAVGKWQALMKPGKYIVHIVKTDTATKNKIEAIQDINVPNMNSAFILPVAIVKKI